MIKPPEIVNNCCFIPTSIKCMPYHHKIGKNPTGQNLDLLPKVAGKWMFIPPKCRSLSGLTHFHIPIFWDMFLGKAHMRP